MYVCTLPIPMYVYYMMFSVQCWWQMNNVFDFFYIYSNDGLPYVLYIRCTKTHKHNIPIHAYSLYTVSCRHFIYELNIGIIL